MMSSDSSEDGWGPGAAKVHNIRTEPHSHNRCTEVVMAWMTVRFNSHDCHTILWVPSGEYPFCLFVGASSSRIRPGEVEARFQALELRPTVSARPDNPHGPGCI